jgi:hypothetical protein
MAPDRTILHLVEKKIQVGGRPRSTPVQNYGVHTIKPQLRPSLNDLSAVAFTTGMINKTHKIVSVEGVRTGFT